MLLKILFLEEKMKSFSRLSALAVTLTVMLLFGVSCAKKGETAPVSGQKDVKDIRVGLSIGHTQEERWQRELEMFKAYAKANNFELLDQSAEGNVQRQVSQCENLISQGIDVLILQSIDADAVAPIIQSAHDEGIKVVAYDRFAMNCDLDYYITFDSFKVGVVQASFVVNKVNQGNFIWLKGSADDNNAHLVADGQRSILQPYIDKGDINIILEQWCQGWAPNEALRYTENGLTMTNNNIQAIVASNDGTAGGAIQALIAQNLAGKVPISGQDADLAACQRIVEGTQTGTAYKPLAKLNLAACELAVAIATGKEPKTSINPALGSWTRLHNNLKDVDSFSVDVTPIDQSNIYEVLIVQDKFQKLEDVYKNIPRNQWPN
jgi:D-xylose transport system substrate-binding protein